MGNVEARGENPARTETGVFFCRMDLTACGQATARRETPLVS